MAERESPPPPAAGCWGSGCQEPPSGPFKRSVATAPRPQVPAGPGPGPGHGDGDRGQGTGTGPCAGCPRRAAVLCLLQPLQVPALVLLLVLGEHRALSCTLLWEQRLRPWRWAWRCGACALCARPAASSGPCQPRSLCPAPKCFSGCFFFFLVSATNTHIPKLF